MSTHLAYTMNRAKSLRRQFLRLATRADALRNTRNLVARDLLAPQGPFRPKAKLSRRRPCRHPRHRKRFLEESMV